ncbi:MAG: UDP-N-acetylmuramoyl-L-alanyl-D-glutamate--2,6-diaminopimelate ligase [Candidatus Azobacteroides pseudotrichonymphae]|jgi:UDP-N-acetylmuramoyl-L-alanyl-D-glutamate--2,6-diaminopimelate ligase|nr:UDP-N-acetylmuramoyl-L-alanyl-D-glutamate--2,6-diaminopimelate ligase [Bacteroidales bacterium OttesenSCG-928-I14]GMO33684.1 MAG: UDP-N-acetylmuramoyl-L-alanyl-D-glutamate--2,6-diaminopimelate ligase [Candidatus Azobacteroides pseudotrichonymphae]
MRLVFEGKELSLSGVHSDSRKIKAGYLFVAIVGTQMDGHSCIEKSIKNGAKTIICQTLPVTLRPDVTYICVKDSAKALGQIVSLWNGEPSKKLRLIGVTGTNGKTTVTTLLYRVFRKLGYKVGLISTICNCINDRIVPTTHTTPDVIELNTLLVQMVSEGCDYVFMEVSSHAIDQKRIAGLQFKGGIFTNLTRDHLDYHKTFDIYRDVKKTFFDLLPTGAFALANKDDKNGAFMLQNTKAHKKFYSLQSLADFKSRILELHFNGTLMTINDKELSTLLVGKFNAYNLLAIYGTAILLGQNSDEILVLLSVLRPVIGRFETLNASRGFTVIVDYAHTPDALINVLNTINEILARKGKIITVIGCGGNRDKGKRSIMAREAVRLSQKVILTSDNPRFEEPGDIIEDMLAGLDDIQQKETICIVDRKEAIRTACLLAQPNDIVLIAGKGHEDYQEIKGVKNHFNDKKVVMEIIN